MSINGRVEPVQGTLIRIMDEGKLLELDYDGAMTGHMGSLWWGTAVGYRAMQVAAIALSQDELWSRDNLYIVTGHPGGGVADSVNYVTRVVERNRYKIVRDQGAGMGCHSGMKYDWWVTDGKKTAGVRLREDFVPDTFYTLADRLGKPTTTAEDNKAFDIFKVNLSAKVWVAPLSESFSVEVTNSALPVGELPAPMLAVDYWDKIRNIFGVAPAPAP